MEDTIRMLRIIRREEKEGKEGGQKKGEELEQEGPSRDQNWREKERKRW